MKSDYKKTALQSLTNVGHQMIGKKKNDPELYQAVKSISEVTQNMVQEVYPRFPDLFWELRIPIAGPVLAVETSILPNYSHVRMPSDDSWTVQSISIDQIIATCQIAPTSASLILDIQVSQSHGSAVFKSMFKSGNSNKIVIPIGIKMVKANTFSVNELNNDDLIRIDCLQINAICSGIELHFQGIYKIQEKV